MANGPCAIYGKHKMRSPKLVGVRDMNGNYINSMFKIGSMFTCGCGDRILTSGSPNTGDYIGYYVTEGGIKAGRFEPSGVGGGYYMVPSNMVYYKGSNVLDGYEF